MLFPRFCLVAVVTIVVLGCKMDDPLFPEEGQFFTVRVVNEQFVMFVTDAETIRLATENFQGKNNHFPIGRIQPGNGGYNRPWSWRYIPETVRMTEAAMEVCDGLPSYVDTHLNDYLVTGYCPWAGRIIKIGR